MTQTFGYCERRGLWFQFMSESLRMFSMRTLVWMCLFASVVSRLVVLGRVMEDGPNDDP